MLYGYARVSSVDQSLTVQEDALKAAHGEILSQRTRIGELLGQIRDLEAEWTEEAIQRITTENTTLKQRVRQLTTDNRTLDERLKAARSNMRFQDRRLASIASRLAADDVMHWTALAGLMQEQLPGNAASTIPQPSCEGSPNGMPDRCDHPSHSRAESAKRRIRS